MLAQGLALGMTSMEKRFRNWGHTVEDDDIDVTLAALDQKLIVHSLRIMTFENAECNEERMEGSELVHLLQPPDLGNRDKHNLFDECMDSTERLDAFVTDKPTDIEVDKVTTDYMDEDPTALMLREEGTYWKPLAIVEATTELKN